MPIDAMHPHCEQSGSPPNWHGSTIVLKSAENERVVCAKTQRSGDAGGRRNSLITLAGISNFGLLSRRRSNVATTLLRSSAERISGLFAPRCGVKKLIQIFSTLEFADQKSTNSSM